MDVPEGSRNTATGRQGVEDKTQNGFTQPSMQLPPGQDYHSQDYHSQSHLPQNFSRQRLPGSLSADAGQTRDLPPHGGDSRSNPADMDGNGLPVREKSLVEKPKKPARLCQKCGEPLTGQFVRALGGTFHLECFKCRDCGEIVASKFFPVDEENEQGQYPLCETDYFRRLDLLCFNCGGALRGSYVTALDRKYHIDHFTCSVCPTAFGAKDSYYEHEGRVYCHYHYSTRFAQRCNGCQTAILKQFVEIFRNGQNQHWHPECYMIHKFWSVRLAGSKDQTPEIQESADDADDVERSRVRNEEDQMEEKTYRIWSILSAFEEASAACISDMLLHVSNGAYVEGVLVAKKFINHVELLFTGLDRLDQCISSFGVNGLSYGREAKLLCKRIVAFFTLLTKTQDTGVKRLGVTQELLSLVTGLAHYLKLLIRIGLQGALKLEREHQTPNGLNGFLDDLGRLDTIAEAEVVLEDTASLIDLASEQSDLCRFCMQPIDDECLRAETRRWHIRHVKCVSCGRELGREKGQGQDIWDDRDQKPYCGICAHMAHGSPHELIDVLTVTRLQQYVYLLRIALARLLSVLRAGGTLPHTSDDPNLQQYDSSGGHHLMPNGQVGPPMLRPETRSKSSGWIPGEPPQESSYAQTVGEMKRLRSTRLEQRLSTTGRNARTSRIIEGPGGMDLVSSNGAAGNSFRVIEDQHPMGERRRTGLSFSEGLTLDDIPRIVAAENAKSQRPNAHKYAGDQLLPKDRRPHRQSIGAVNALGATTDMSTSSHVVDRPKKFFSELSGLEYFIVRHIAVLQVQPLVEGHFNLETLLSLIEPRKQTFWNKFFPKGQGKGKPGKTKGMFGVNLDSLVERAGVESTYGVGPQPLRVPGLLDDAVQAMRQMDMSVEGVFRKNGNIKRLKEMAEKLDTGAEMDLGRESPVQVAALLKKFLRDMPDPILTHKLYELWITAMKLPDMEKRRRLLHLTCCLLPKSHRDSMEILFAFLNWTASFSQVDEESGSKMDTHNLATVIAPNIISPTPKGSDIPGMEDSFLAVEAVNMLLEYNDEMCEVPEDIQTVLTDSELFNNMPEPTTKEILKRYGDMAKSTSAHTAHINPADTDFAAPQRAGTDNANGSGVLPMRVDVDPKQGIAWQKESSVRHIQGNGLPQPQFSGSSHNTPPQIGGESQPRSSPSHHQRQGSGDSAKSNGQPRYQKQASGLGKHTMAVGGN